MTDAEECAACGVVGPVDVACRGCADRPTPRDLEVAGAHLERALVALGHLERILTKIGGYLEHRDQAALFEARAVLAEHGRRPAGTHAPWVDRR